MESAVSLSEAKQTATQYAAYARDASGLGNVAGAVLVLLTASLPRTAFLHWWTRTLVATTPFWWVLIKEQLRSRYYQQFGYVQPRTNVGERVYSLVMVAFAIFASVVAAGVLITSAAQNSSPVTFSLILSLLVLLTVPFLTWRYMRGKYELIPGLFLVFQSASVMSTSSSSMLLGSFFQLPAVLVAVVMFFAGIDQHRRFLKFKRMLAARGDQQS